MTAGTLTAETLTKAYLARIALTNAEGPAIQAVRVAQRERASTRRRRSTRERRSEGLARAAARHPGAARRLDRRRTGCRRRAARSRCRTRCRRATRRIVAKLKAAGAIILGKTNVTELNGLFDANMPEGYSSLGGQVLLPSDTDKTPGRLVRRLGGGDGRRASRR